MSRTLLTILFALAVVIFLSTLPWLIGLLLDRKRTPRNHPAATTIREDDIRP
jgi:hypothetical protein